MTPHRHVIVTGVCRLHRVPPGAVRPVGLDMSDDPCPPLQCHPLCSPCPSRPLTPDDRWPFHCPRGHASPGMSRSSDRTACGPLRPSAVSRSLRPRSLPVLSWPTARSPLALRRPVCRDHGLLTCHLGSFRVRRLRMKLRSHPRAGFCVDVFSGDECRGAGGWAAWGEHVQFCRKPPKLAPKGAAPVAFAPAMSELFVLHVVTGIWCHRCAPRLC